MRILDHVTLVSPLWLVLVPAAGLLVWRLRRGVRWWQLAAATALILAAADPVVRWRGRSCRRIALIPAGNDAARHVSGEKRLYSGDPADALTAAGATVAPDEGAEIRLYAAPGTFGPRLARAAQHLNRRGVRVFVFPTEAARTPAGLLSLTYPLTCGAGATAAVSGKLAFPDRREFVVAIRDEAGRILARTGKMAAAGPTEFILHPALTRPGVRRLRLEADGRELAAFRIRVREPYRALLVSDRPEDGAALRRILAGRVRVELFSAQSGLSGYPLYIFGPGGAGRLTPAQLEEVASQVRDGSGLLLFCGRERPFDPAAVPAAFAELAPVRYPGKDLDRAPTTALVVIIDTSGSMSGVRIALARETARLAVDRLRECDMAGIVEFHGRRRWAAPLQSAANQLELHRALNRLSAGGGTVILPALQEAFYALRNVDARLKHILILTDGGVERGDFASLLRRMAAHDITVSTVMVGPGRSDFLAQLAVWGHGRHYNAASRFALPELNFRQFGRETLPPYREGEFPVTAAAAEPGASDWPEGISVQGVWESVPRPGAVTMLRAGRWPLLVLRECRMGQAAALNTDLAGAWSSRLSGTSEFAGWLAALARRLPDAARLERFDFRNRSRGGDAEILIDAPPEISELAAELHFPAGEPEKFRLFRRNGEPFRFRRYGLAPGEYELAVRGGGAADRVPFTLWPDTADDPEAAAAGIARRSRRLAAPLPAWRSLRLRPVFAVLFILLMLTQVGLRRLASRMLLAGVAALTLSAFGGEYAAEMRRGMRTGDPEAYRRAAAAAANPADRRMARLLQLESVRDDASAYRKLLAQWRVAAATDSELLLLLSDELEDSDRPREALTLLENIRCGRDAGWARRLIRLAEKCGRSELIRRRAAEALAAAPGDPFWLRAAVRLDLLKGDRAGAERRLAAGIAAAASEEDLMDLIATAEEAALYPAALTAIRELETRRDADPWAARFRELEIFLRQGAPERALVRLRRWSEAADLPIGAAMKAADWSEQLGDDETALRFYRKLSDGEAAIRRAMLLQNMGRRAEAREIWWRLAVDPAGGMRALQAMESCIALAAADRDLPRLIRRIRDHLAGNDLELSARFYCRALAAAGDENALFAFLADPGRERMRLDFLLEFKRFPAAAELIDRLRLRHPEEAESLLRRKLLIAVESRDRKLADAAVAELFAVARDRAAAWEYAAGVYSLLGDPAGALRGYDECLKLAPDRIELYLLRANAQKSVGEGAAAIAFFRSLLIPATPPDLFGVAVDGLLNLDAPAAELRNALTAVRARLRFAPEDLFFYQLAGDLAEALGETEERDRLLFRQLAVAPERRGLLLRQLFLAAQARSDRREALRFARLLLGLNEIYSPELYRALSRCLIDNGRFAAAERCVRDADAAENSTHHLFDFVLTCMEAGRGDAADRICRELLSLRPDSPELLARYAAVKEMQNDILAAGRLNLAALKLLASRATSGTERSGNSRDDAARRFRPLIRAFANQAVIFPEEFDAELERLTRTASAGARRLIWSPVCARLRALRLPPPVGSAPARKSGGVTPTELAVRLSVLPPDAAAAELAAVLDRLPSARKNAFLPRLIGALADDPAPAVAARLARETAALKLRDGNWNWPLIPGAMALKLALAEEFLRQCPESFHAQVLLARTRWVAGDAAGARRLAAVVFQRFTELDAFTLPLIRAVRELNPVCGAADGEADGRAGAEFRAGWIAELAGDEALLGPRPARRILLAILRDGAGECDAALELMFRTWREGERTLPVFRLMEELTLKTGRGGEFLRTLLAAPPKDAAVNVLYARRLVQLLRETGDNSRAREYLAALPDALRRREQLLLDREHSTAEEFTAGLRRFLTEQCRNGGAVGMFDDEFGLGGLLGRRRRGELRENMLTALAADTRRFGAVMAYLAQGIPVTEPGFAPVFNACRRLPLPRIVAADTPARLALKAAGGGSLTASECDRLAALVRNPGVPPETALALLRYLPPSVRSGAADALALRLCAGRMLDRQLAILAEVMPFTTPERRIVPARKLLSPDSGGSEASVRLARLALIARWTPELYPAARREIVGAGVPAADTDLQLVFGPGAPEARFRRYFAAGGGFPDWERIMLLIPAPERRAFAASAAAALEHALRDGHLTPDLAVRHFVLLAGADPERAAQYLSAAARHDRRLGEATLWRLDALKGPERQRLFEQLRRAGRLMPARESRFHHQPLKKGREK